MEASYPPPLIYQSEGNSTKMHWFTLPPFSWIDAPRPLYQPKHHQIRCTHRTIKQQDEFFAPMRMQTYWRLSLLIPWLSRCYSPSSKRVTVHVTYIHFFKNNNRGVNHNGRTHFHFRFLLCCLPASPQTITQPTHTHIKDFYSSTWCENCNFCFFMVICMKTFLWLLHQDSHPSC